MDNINRNHSEEDEQPVGKPAIDLAPSGELEDRIVTALKDTGLIKSSRQISYQPLKLIAAILVIGVTFFSGWLAGHNNMQDHAAPNNSQHTRQYLLLTYDPAGFIASDKQNEEYGRWVSALGEEHIATAGELSNNGWLLRKDKMQSFAGGAFPGKDMTASGFFIINAASDNKAIEMASACPHLKYNGLLELRPVN